MAIPELKILQNLLVNPAGADLSWLASLIDHTLLKPEASDEQHLKLCEEAKKFHFATVCVYASKIALCRKHLVGSAVKPIAVIGFPVGNVPTNKKIEEAKFACAEGALEIDMVLNVEAMKAKNYALAFQDIEAVVRACEKIPVKVILETCLLTLEEKIAACALSKAAGAAFVKTSTGFSTSGATIEDVSLMRQVVGENFGVKASGGIRNFQDAIKMVIAGANRIGTSAGVEIVSGKSSAAGAY